MRKFNKLTCSILTAAMLCSLFTGCNKSDSNSTHTETSKVITETIAENNKTEKIYGTYNISSLIDIQILGANPNLAVKVSKVPDSSYKQHIEYVKVNNKIASGFELNDSVEIVIKFNNNVDITELSLDGCSTDAESNTCVYNMTIDTIVGEYVSGADYANANNALNNVCNGYADIIANKLPGGTWGSNKTIKKVKGYTLVNSYSAVANKANADDSISLGKEASRLSKAINGIIREYAFDLVYSDGTEATVCTMLILPNVYKMTNGSYKLVDSNNIYNVGAFKVNEENEILNQFKGMSITLIDMNSVSIITNQSASTESTESAGGYQMESTVIES